jgi:uncharacterized protein (TIGR02246 family)
MRNAMIALIVLALATSVSGVVVAQEPSDAEEAVEMVASHWADAWNAGDMESIGALYTETSDYVSLFGETLKGREQIQAFFTEVHSTVYKGAKFSHETTTIRFVKPDIAIGDTAWEFTGVAETEGPTMPSKGLSTTVLVKQDGEWKIVAQRAQVPSVPAGGEAE